MWMLLLAAAFAAPPTVRARDLALSGRPEAALALLAREIADHPDDLPAVWTYTDLSLRTMRGGSDLERVLRARLERTPRDEAARIALGLVLVATHENAGGWCAEAEELAAGKGGEDGDFVRARLRYEIHRLCPGDREADRTALLALADRARRGPAQALAVSIRLRDPVEEALADDLADAWRHEPWLLALGTALWSDRATGQALERARADAVAAARGLYATDDPAVLAAAVAVLRAARDPGAPDFVARLDGLDPGRRADTSWMSVNGARWLARGEREEGLEHLRAIDDADRRSTWRGSLRALEELDDDVPPDGLVRATLETTRATNLEGLGDTEAALEARRDAWEADPDSGDAAAAWALAAARAAADQEAALAALTRILARREPYDPRGDRWVTDEAAWRAQVTADRAEWLVARGWLLYRMGRPAEGLADLLDAQALGAAGADADTRLGLVLAATGHPDAALLSLGRGLTPDAPGLDRLDQDVRARGHDVLAGLLADRWVPGGVDTWLAGMAPAPEPPPSAVTEEEDALIGTPFPDLPLHTDAGEVSLSSIDGWRVVDLWATWCGPCIESFPHLDRLARMYRGRAEVIAVSVDDSEAVMRTFLADQPSSAARFAWSGPEAQEAAKSGGIPSLYVIDPDGIIRAHVVGYGPGDHRAENALDELLAP